MSDEEEKCPECVPGLPAWMGTFADLMSLLMCFFVLLLSFAEMDVIKFKRLAGSMREAFGVQRQIDANSIPMGTSIIMQEFSPGKPEPTPLNVVQQQTTDSDSPDLYQVCEEEIKKALEQECTNVQGQDLTDIVVEKIRQLSEETENEAMEMATSLQQEMRNNQVEIETRGRRIVIRIQEKGSFKSGSARLDDAFIPVVEKMIDLLTDLEGPISVEGHTDDVPIRTAQFRSNWDLSTARALEVAYNLFSTGELAESRFSVAGYADTKPLVENDSAENRARNRRVEIILQQPLDDATRAELESARSGANTLLQPEQARDLGLQPNEIF